MQECQSGDKVQVHYTGRFEGGEVFDSSEGREPLEFNAGSQDIIPGVSQAVIGMKVGDKKTVNIPPEEGYGPHDPERTQTVDRGLLPPEAQVGTALRAQTNEGGQMTVWVTEMDEDSAVIDANHPLAGKNLVFDLELVGFGE